MDLSSPLPHFMSSYSKGLFRGLTPCLIRAVPAAASTFVAFEYTHKFLIDTVGL